MISYNEDIEERRNENRNYSRNGKSFPKVPERVEVYEFLELYTSPGSELVHKVIENDKRIKTLQGFLKIKDDEIEKLKGERDDYREQLRRRNEDIAKLRAEKREAEEAFNKVWGNDPSSVIDVYSSTKRCS